MKQSIASWLRHFVVMGCVPLAALAFLAGCAGHQQYATVTVGPSATGPLKPGDLEAYGIAFITPATVTGQEEDRPALALIFSQVLEETRPATHIVPLNATLSAITRAGASEDYNRMVMKYRDLGTLDPATLALVSNATGARYIAQLQMANFQQESQDRFSVLGLRMVMTKKANIRLFLRIWNGQEGSIAWEGAQELYMAKETVTENAISFRDVVELSAREIIAKIP
jgi:hypothetical protein